jgi:nuclear GTP-binding protein
MPAEPQSKRVPVRLRHKIEKASAAKQRKQRKLAKQNPQWRTRLKKDPGIPNLFPFKEKLLNEIAERKREKEEEAARRRVELRNGKRSGTAQDEMADGDGMDGDGLLDEDVDLVDEDMEVSGSGTTNPVILLIMEGRT